MDRILSRKITIDEFAKFDVDGDGRIERTEFALRKLMLMGIVEPADVARVEKEFDQMDADGSGEVTLKDLEAHLKAQEKEKEELLERKKRGAKKTRAKQVQNQYENMVEKI
ncbi:hypothetical protein TrST_g5766 [Triparma strigata]|uniref:EF-hand domain-containing protein n=1 Tax=Triparma strigata TaxID=1606541 RepID=A0A9W6ZNB8_9STRA|nr:hypothetical protein TrST_g5766 [Triparma strigata]